MAKIVRRISTLRALESKTYPKGRNATVSFGNIGKPCLRQLWYDFHWASPAGVIPASVQRIFNCGHDFEPQIIAELKAIGCFVFAVHDGKAVEIFGGKDEKQEVFLGSTGHTKGKPDARVLGVPEAAKTEHLGEFKTMNQKRFDKVVKNGVQKGHPVYYAQCQRLMLAMKLERTLFIAINKNDSKLYVERLYYDAGFGRDLIKKENHIITSDAPPMRTEGTECNWCDHAIVCKQQGVPERNCRTCDYVDLDMGGVWYCGKHDKNLTYDEQGAGCDHYELGWGLK